MTSQTLTLESPARSSGPLTAPPLLADSSPKDAERQARLLEAMKSQYPVDQQVKFLHLQAEAESLLQQLQAIKQQRQSQ